jgi:translation initiation factor 2 beta subunit (eIF-2beta)/eIF-5
MNIEKCPFCRFETTKIYRSDKYLFQVECTECGSRGPVGDTEISATRSWNKIEQVSL